MSAQRSTLQRSMTHCKSAQRGTAQPLARYIAIDTFSNANARRPIRCRENSSMHAVLYPSWGSSPSCSAYIPIDCPSPGARILYVSWGVSWTVSRDVLSVVSWGVSRGVPSIVGTVGLGSGSPPLASPRFGTESDLEIELVESAARFNCDQLWANHVFRQLELKIQISSVRIRRPRAS